MSVSLIRDKQIAEIRDVYNVDGQLWCLLRVIFASNRDHFIPVRECMIHEDAKHLVFQAVARQEDMVVIPNKCVREFLNITGVKGSLQFRIPMSSIHKGTMALREKQIDEEARVRLYAAYDKREAERAKGIPFIKALQERVTEEEMRGKAEELADS